MSDGQEQPWERQEGESTMWYERFLVYLRMGPSRTFLSAVNEALKQEHKSDVKSSIPGAWWNVIKTWNWKERAIAFDEYRRKQVFTQGNAYDLARVEKLNKYSERLEQELDKMFAALPKRIKKPWFNNFLYEKYLQTLEALAAETGGRVKKNQTEISFPPDVYEGIGPNDDGSKP